MNPSIETVAAYLAKAASQLTRAQFDVDKNNEAAVRMVSEWIQHRVQVKSEPQKGVLLIGNVGSGKTLLMRAASQVLVNATGMGFAVKNCHELVRMYNAEGFGPELERWSKAKLLCIDDLGTENEGMHFGSRVQVISELFELRYQNMQHGIVEATHFTTNLGAPAIKERYGERFYSRLVHCCNAVALGASKDAADRRKTAPPMQRPESLDADNIYSVIHPDVAQRLSASMAEVRAARAKPEEAPREMPSHEKDLANFTEFCAQQERDRLRLMRESYMKHHQPGTLGYASAMDYVAVIDAALAKVQE